MQQAVAFCVDYNIANCHGKERKNSAKLGSKFPFRSCCVRYLIDLSFFFMQVTADVHSLKTVY